MSHCRSSTLLPPNLTTPDGNRRSARSMATAVVDRGARRSWRSRVWRRGRVRAPLRRLHYAVAMAVLHYGGCRRRPMEHVLTTSNTFSGSGNGSYYYDLWNYRSIQGHLPTRPVESPLCLGPYIILSGTYKLF